MYNIAIIPAAGFGKRVGTKTNKQFLKLKGIPTSIYTMRKIADSPLINEIIPVIRPDEISMFKNKILKEFPVKKIKKIVPGGIERQDSVYNAINSIEHADLVLVHDGVRPLFQSDLIEKCLEKANSFEACAVAIKAVDTIKTGFDGFFKSTLDRNTIFQIQTPQAFKYSLLKKAYDFVQNNKIKITDDAQAIEIIGEKVAIIEGSRYNFKITTKEDLKLARLYLRLKSE
jgi:2-C-methyl-D-erythritol 4-phosphate cytidylyltransferase